MRKLVLLPVLVLFCGALLASSPDPPTGNQPPNGAQDVPAGAVLCAQVSDPDEDLLDVAFFGRELTGQPAEDFTIVVLPDTQHYPQTYHDIFHSQASWVVDQRVARNIAFVTHVGDIVELGRSEFEWSVVDAAMGRLEDPATTQLEDGMPYGMAVGNHDQFLNDDAGTLADQGATTEQYNQFFGVSRYEDKAYYGGHFGTNNDNNFQLFSAGGMDFIIFHLEFDHLGSDLREPVLEWVDGLLQTYADRRAIITSHHLLCPGTNCGDTLWAPFSIQGQVTYDALKHNPNLFLMTTGHSSNTHSQPRRTDTFGENTIHTLLANYQRGEPCPYRCGNGWLRILTFRPSENQIVATTYSPWLDEYKTGTHHEFVLDYDMNGGLHFQQIGSVEDVSSGMSACITWTDLKQDADYEWFVEVSDAAETTTGPPWTFGSDGYCDLPTNCDDSDPCTVDECKAVSCEHQVIPGCCGDAGDCDDGNPCVDDSCVEGFCTHVDNTDPCHDGDPCTENDICAAGSCAGNTVDCDDGNACTQDACVDGSCESTYEPLATCCVLDVDCFDHDPCTQDTCDAGSCLNVAAAGCCLVDNECSDGEACTADICVSGNDAALALTSTYGHVTMARLGIEGNTAVFPGLRATEFTVECWFKWTGGGIPVATSGYVHDSSDVGGIEAYPLVAKGIVDQEVHPGNPLLSGKVSVNYLLGILEPGHVLAADLEEHPSGENPSSNHPILGTTVIDPGEWHHAAATYDGQCWQLYLDGQPETDGSNCPMVLPAFETLHFFSVGIGQGWEGLVEGSFLGLIDEVRVWNRALGQAEIQARMTTQVVAHRDLLGRWSFDEPGPVVFDTSGNENHGIVVGAGFETVDLVDLGGNDCAFRSPAGIDGLLLRPAVPCGYYECDLPPIYTKLRWLENAPVGLPYDVASGAMGDLWADAGTDLAECLIDDRAGPYHADAGLDPAPGQGWYYMIREQGPCGAGSYGQASSGQDRLPLDGCP